jgi:hypothetical protein
MTRTISSTRSYCMFGSSATDPANFRLRIPVAVTREQIGPGSFLFAFDSARVRGCRLHRGNRIGSIRSDSRIGQPEQPGRGEGCGCPGCPMRALKTVDETSRGLRCMCPAVAAEALKSEIGSLVDESSVFLPIPVFSSSEMSLRRLAIVALISKLRFLKSSARLHGKT